MKPSLLTQAFKVFLAKTMYSAKKAKAVLMKSPIAKNEIVGKKKDFSKTEDDYIIEDQQFRNKAEEKNQ